MSQKESSSTSPSRRVFMMAAACGGAGIALGAHAQAPAKLDEKDPQAVALGYVADTAKADKAKYPKHAADQKCGNCQLYTGKPADAAGPCTLFANKLVPGGAWCSAWVKKPA